MPAVTFSPSFFRNELRAYTNWVQAFWRELIQNSVDASAYAIWINLAEIDYPEPTGSSQTRSDLDATRKKHLKITFEDDGPGMDRRTLEKTYFVVGESTKTGSSIGGFGRARIITCFAQESFKIHTQDSLCQGAGTHYTIEDAPEPYEGCRIEIIINPHLAALSTMETALQNFLKTCQIDTPIYIGGNRFKSWMHKNRMVGELRFGKIYLNKAKRSNGVVIRVKGVQMFTRDCASTWQIVVELDPAQSRQTLTSNRDGFTGSAATELDQFIGKIWTNPLSAVRGRNEKTEIFGNTIYQVQARKHLRQGSTNGTAHPAHAENHGLTQHLAKNQTDRANARIITTAPATNGNHNSVQTNGNGNSSNGYPDTYSRSLSHPHLNTHYAPGSIPCYVHVLDCSTPEITKAAKEFLPDQIRGIRAKLLQKWTGACAIAATELAEMEDKTFRFRTGFLFNEEHSARCVGEGNIYTLLLNPLTPKGLLKYKLSSRTDWADILCQAAHEALHMEVDYHDEYYAAKLTDLMARIMASHFTKLSF